MKKILISLMSVTMLVSVAMAVDQGTGTADQGAGLRVGTGAMIASGVTGGIAIGDSAGIALVKADNAVQIGTGSNLVANTIHFGSIGYISATNVNPWSAANLTAGTTASAINGAAITNLTAGNIKAGTLVTGIKVVGGYYPASAAAEKTMVQAGTSTSGTTITFGTAYASAPSLVCTFAGVTTHHLAVTSCGTTTAVCTDQDGAATNGLNWVAVGTVP